MAYDERTAERVRRLLEGREDVAEIRMMGGLCFMVGGHMACGVSGDALLVRVGREGYAAALALPHVRPMELAGRRPGGFVFVDPEGHRDDAALAAWVQRGVAVAAALPPKKPAAGKPEVKKTRRRA